MACSVFLPMNGRLMSFSSQRSLSQKCDIGPEFGF